jgi:TolB-like protein
VLPIEDLHPDPENLWFADGLTQELIHVLSQIERLRVRDRKSVKNYDMTGKSAERMADELGVQYLLEGADADHSRVDRCSDRRSSLEPDVQGDDGGHLRDTGAGCA